MHVSYGGTVDAGREGYGTGWKLSVVFSFRHCLYCSANKVGMKVGEGGFPQTGREKGEG